ncbi:putative inorganic phosphate transporter 1-10 [Quercus suber]|uniref:Inorganic phosphate transporter 1-10 n=1 Tax=Quercus suber TaxID=58331 RepID=A0AAW0LRJ6_QUESU
MDIFTNHALKNARTQYYHFKGTIIAGMGLLTDAYDFFSIPLVMIRTHQKDLLRGKHLSPTSMGSH